MGAFALGEARDQPVAVPLGLDIPELLPEVSHRRLVEILLAAFVYFLIMVA